MEEALIEDHGQSHEAQNVDDLEIEFDFDGATAEVTAMPDDGGYPNLATDQAYAKDQALDISQDNYAGHDRPGGLSTETGDAHLDDTNHHSAGDAGPHDSTRLTPKPESEIYYEEDEPVPENRSHSHGGQNIANHESALGGTGIQRDEDEDEITYDEGDEAGARADLEQEAHGTGGSEGLSAQQVLGGETEQNDGMAFDFEGLANESAADDIHGAVPDAPSENSDADESFAEEIGIGSLEDLRPGPDDEDPEDGYDSSSESNEGLGLSAGADFRQSPHHSASGSESAERYNPAVVVQYCGQDYDLFAQSEDASPDSYFLSQLAPLDYTLSEFLVSLRKMLAGDVSAKERIAFRIDSLGLEFGETTSKDFLSTKSLRMILSVHQQLQKNDNPMASGAVYAHLVTHTDCAARFEELVEGVKKGYGLSAFTSASDGMRDAYGHSQHEAHSSKVHPGAEFDQDGDSSEHYSDNEDESGEGDVEATNGHGTTKSGGTGSFDADVGDENDEEDEGESFYPDDDDEDEALGDELDTHFDDGTDQGQPTYEEMVTEEYGAEDVEDVGFQEGQPSYGAFIGEAGNQAGDETQAGVADPEDAGYDEGVEEFVDYDDGDQDGTVTNEVAAADGKHPLFTTSQIPRASAANYTEDGDLIEYSDDETIPAATEAIPKPKSESALPSSPCQRKSAGLPLADGGDLIDYSDDEMDYDVEALLHTEKLAATSVAARLRRITDSLRPCGPSTQPRKGAIPASPVQDPLGRGSVSVEHTAGGLAVPEMSPRWAPCTLSRHASSVLLGDDGMPRQEQRFSVGARGGGASTRVQMPMVAAQTIRASVDRSGSYKSDGLDFSFYHSNHMDANLSDHQGAASHEFDNLEHESEQHTGANVNEQQQSLVSESSAAALPLGNETEPQIQEPAGQETASHPTSATSTLHGDEFRVDGTDVAIESLPTATTHTPTGVAAPQNFVDEIDWEDHGDDEQALTVEESTSLNTSAKRHRPENGPGDLAEETESKRRRT